MSSIQTEWNLSKYFYQSVDDPQITLDYQQVVILTDEYVAKYKGKIASLTPSQLVKFFQEESKIDSLITKLWIYLTLQTSLESQNQIFLKKEGEMERKVIELSNKFLFVNQEFKAMGAKKLQELSKEKELKAYNNYLHQKSLNLEHLLDEKTEMALNLKQSSANLAFNKLREELVGSFTYQMTIEGKKKKLTEEEVRAFRMSPVESLRKESFKTIASKYMEKTNQIVLGNTYSAIVKNWASEVKLRGYENVMSPQNLSEEISDQTVENLLQTVTQNFPLYHRYLKAKKNLLEKSGKVEKSQKLKAWNTLAPVSDSHRKYTLEESLEIYFDSLKQFDNEFYQFNKEMFAQGRVDVFPRTGKRGGAFCQYSKDMPSFVLLNFTGDLNSLSTTAHELGHAIHGYFAQKQVAQVYNTGLSLAETASVFGETIFMDYLYQTLTSEDEKLLLLDTQLTGLFSTIFQQVMYVNFEKEVHERTFAGEEFGYLDYNQIWHKQQILLNGDGVDQILKPEENYRWSYIPHIFHTPFYCYSYAFGNILSLSLYEQYLLEGKSFIPKYKEILQSGGSKTPQNLLLRAGIDINSKDFVQKGIDFIQKKVEIYEKLAIS